MRRVLRPRAVSRAMCGLILLYGLCFRSFPESHMDVAMSLFCYRVPTVLPSRFDCIAIALLVRVVLPCPEVVSCRALIALAFCFCRPVRPPFRPVHACSMRMEGNLIYWIIYVRRGARPKAYNRRY